MKKGICIGSLPGDSVEARFKLASDAGFDGIEIGTLGNDADRKKNKSVADDLGVELLGVMNSKHWSHPLSHADETVRKESVQGILDSIETARAIGADTVLLVPAVVNDDITYEDAYSRSQTEIQRLIPKAVETDIKISIENVWNKFLLSPIEFAQYIDAFDSDHIAAYFDVGNIVLYGYPQHWIRSLGSRIDKVHVKGFNANDRRFTYLIEDCTIDWNTVMASFEAIGYDDYITAELPVNRDAPEKTVHQISGDMDKIIAGTI